MTKHSKFIHPSTDRDLRRVVVHAGKLFLGRGRLWCGGGAHPHLPDEPGLSALHSGPPAAGGETSRRNVCILDPQRLCLKGGAAEWALVAMKPRLLVARRVIRPHFQERHF